MIADLERALPNSAEAERAILGAILLNNDLVAQAEAELTAEDFYVPSYRRIFVAMLNLMSMRLEIDPILIAEELKKDNALGSVGGVGFITDLAHGLPRTANIANYARVVKGKSLLRHLKREIAAIDRQIDEEEDEPDVVLAKANEVLFRLNVESRVGAKSSARDYKDVASVVSEMFDRWQAGDSVAVPTQIPELDQRLNYGGLASGDLIVIAARTSFGKSALALQIALSSARYDIPVLIFSLEMSAERLFIRNLASTSQVPHYKISPRTFQYNAGLADVIRGSVPVVSRLPISVDHATRTLRRLALVAREWHRGLTPKQKKRALMITDYMQLVDNKLDRRSRNDEVAGISIELKGAAVELGIPVVGVSQLTRSPAKDNRRPELADLRESGQLEQDADLVLFPWSEDGLKDDQVRGMKLYCPKQRGGQVGWEIPIDFDGDKQWFFTEQMYAQERREIAPRIDFNDD